MDPENVCLSVHRRSKINRVKMVISINCAFVLPPLSMLAWEMTTSDDIVSDVMSLAVISAGEC